MFQKNLGEQSWLLSRMIGDSDLINVALMVNYKISHIP